jgi:hypothetical protein
MHNDPSWNDMSDGSFRIHNVQLLSGQVLTPDPKIETWEWNPSWRFIKRLDLSGDTIGLVSCGVIASYFFHAPIPSSQYIEL